jgi:hypothetical protein
MTPMATGAFRTPYCERSSTFSRAKPPQRVSLTDTLRTATQLTSLIAIFCILAWRVLWLTEIKRSAPVAPPEVALTDHPVRDTARTAQAHPLSRRLIKLAQLGGITPAPTIRYRTIGSSDGESSYRYQSRILARAGKVWVTRRMQSGIRWPAPITCPSARSCIY